jgi:hypothetical protein
MFTSFTFLLSKLKSILTKEEDMFSNLPSYCSYDKNAGVVIITHRGIKGYFTKEMIMEFKKSNIDYIKYWIDSVDEFLDEIDEDELK